MSYLSVYLLDYLGVPLNHHSIFVKDAKDETEFVFYVIGNIQMGCIFEVRRQESDPRLSATFKKMTQIGVIAANDTPRFRTVCESNPPPKKQFNGIKRVDPKKPLRRCQDWERETIDILREQGVLLNAS
ncbi:hypothetical protein ACHAPK_008232 [Fusarium culmorum]|uniref:Uncharacterized protein n=1 Tax=Fusarium culmorum TaxID=5516 RepID=A0A2T4GXE0_FUSCU|nr:hypothetical protein FCULG_00005638 [Fusarium culmorum]